MLSIRVESVRVAPGFNMSIMHPGMYDKEAHQNAPVLNMVNGNHLGVMLSLFY